MIIGDGGMELEVKRSSDIEDLNTCDMLFYYAWEKGELLPIGIFDEENRIDENDYLSYELYCRYVTLTEEERNALEEIYITYAYSYFASNPLYTALSISEIDPDEEYWTLKPNVSYVDPYEDGDAVEYYIVEMAEEPEEDPEEVLESILDELDERGLTDFTKHMGVDACDRMMVNNEYGMCIGAMMIGVNSSIGILPWVKSDIEDLINELSDQYAFNFEYRGRNREIYLDMLCNYSDDDKSFKWEFISYADSIEEVKPLVDELTSYYLYEMDDGNDLSNEDIQQRIIKELSLVKFRNKELYVEAVEYVASSAK